METEVHLIARISSLCVNLKKYATYICAIMQWSLGVTSRTATKSQADSSTALVNYSKKMFATEIYNSKIRENNDNDTMIQQNSKCFSSLKYLST